MRKIYLKKNKQIPFASMNVIVWHSVHPHVWATHVTLLMGGYNNNTNTFAIRREHSIFKNHTNRMIFNCGLVP